MLHSVVVPVYNEVSGIREFHQRVSAAMQGVDDDYEIVYVNDGSTDGSFDELCTLQKHDRHIRVISLSRNFGHQIAITAGMDHSSGDTVTVIDADLQDPPELIPALVARWHQGADVVFAVRSTRAGETAFKRVTAKSFYRLLNWFAEVDIPSDAGDFRLMSRRAIDALHAMPEHHRYVRGMVAWIGFDTDSIAYPRDARFAGETKYPLRKMMRLAVDGVLGFSTRPLRIAVWLGLTTGALAFATGVWAIVERFSGRTVAGWTSTIVVVLFAAGAQLLTIGVLGEYLGRIYAEVRRRPLYLVGDLRGFEGPPPLGTAAED